MYSMPHRGKVLREFRFEKLEPSYVSLAALRHRRGGGAHSLMLSRDYGHHTDNLSVSYGVFDLGCAVCCGRT